MRLSELSELSGLSELSELSENLKLKTLPIFLTQNSLTQNLKLFLSS
jgi:hypothetical protein